MGASDEDKMKLKTEALNPVVGLRESNQLTKGPSLISDEKYCDEMLTKKKKVNFSQTWLPGQFPAGFLTIL